MAYLGTLALGLVFLVLLGFVHYVVLALWVMKNILCLNVLIYNPFGIDMHACSGFNYDTVLLAGWIL